MPERIMIKHNNTDFLAVFVTMIFTCFNLSLGRLGIIMLILTGVAIKKNHL